ncbi:tripartite tricarboxylate transporter substrate binding protein [Roseomonas hellenica]|uniref:Tripartite tricarboxylate transporter substrate binding protein n=1 Tax=Plastoroseomonas hellenica TaxID=2687306 RepID=A0ABS5ET79_9PROT|nr:tripartite tricarboxylate transporter substrate-binding protein [Plastoroseomonas hellenica]MBR0663458.1 tripartite tricarboxylate transporter substrate binding protein [Plastoroseomonas hellenica]
MPSRRAVLALSASSILTRPAAAQGAGTHRLVIPFPPGGTMDNVARQMAPAVQAEIGRTVVIENRPGGGTVIGTEAVSRAAPDGQTTLMVANSFLINGSMQPNLTYDPLRDFRPIALLTVVPHVLVVAPAVAQDFTGFLAAARRPGPGLSFGSYGNGTSNHLGAEQLKILARLNATHVPYRGAAQAYTDLFAGRVEFMFMNEPDVAQPTRAGQIRPLAIAAPQRSSRMSEVPTLAELGFGQVLSDTWFGVVAPAAVPAPIAARLSAAWLAALAKQEVAARLTDQAFSILGVGADAFGARMRRDFATYAEVIRAANVRTD